MSDSISTCPCGGKIIWWLDDTTSNSGPVLSVEDNGMTAELELAGKCDECGQYYTSTLSGDIVNRNYSCAEDLEIEE